MTDRGGAIHDEIHKRVMRLLMGRNHAELARLAKIPPTTFYSQIERGKFSLEVLEALAPLLGTTLGELVDPRATRPLDTLPVEVKAEGFDQVRALVRFVESREDATGVASDAALALQKETDEETARRHQQRLEEREEARIPETPRSTQAAGGE